MARIPRANHATSPTYIFQRKEFDCNNMSGRWATGVMYGDLNADERETLVQHITDVTDEQEVYIVYSYSTPIAWWTEAHGWHVVKQKFSVTTSKHQSRLHLIK